MNDIKKIFLDLDGPLLDGRERHYFCYRSILQKFGFEPVGINEYWREKRARRNRRELLKLSGAEEIHDDFIAAWLALIESPEVLALDKLQEGAVDCLRGWKEQKKDLIVVTMRKDRQALDDQLRTFALYPLLDAVLVCDHAQGGAGKAAEVRKMYPNIRFEGNTLWVGDTEVDWEAARSLGCNIVLISNGLRSQEYLETLQGALVMPSISSVKDNVLGRPNVS